MSFRRNEFLDVGADIGGYRIVSIVKAGGFGILYRTTASGRRSQLVRRQLGPSRSILLADGQPLVAVKEFFPYQLAQRIDDVVTVSNESYRPFYDKALEKFISESQRLISDFDHPNIVRGVELFADRGTYYLAMEFLQGQNFGDWLADFVRQEGRSPDERVLRGVFEQLFDAVGLVHELDQMHRDIKPDNIMIRRDGTPVLIDFGLVGEGLDRARRGTLTALTPGYAPPEQTGAQFIPINGRIVDLRRQGSYTDIYALGAVLLRTISGRPPPNAEDRIDQLQEGAADGVDTLIAAAEREGYAPPLLQGIRASMQLDPAARPQTVADLRAALGWTGAAQGSFTVIRSFVERSIQAEGAEGEAPPPPPPPLHTLVPPPPTAAYAPAPPTAGYAAPAAAFAPPTAGYAPAPPTQATQAAPWPVGVPPPTPEPDTTPRLDRGPPPQSYAAPAFDGVAVPSGASPVRRRSRWPLVAATLATLALAGGGTAVYLNRDDSRRVAGEFANALPGWASASVDPGRVILTGTAPTDAERDRIIARARLLAGRRELLVRLDVAPRPPSDAEIQSGVAAAIRQGGADRVNVQVTAGSVVLEGRVADEGEKARVVALARGAAGGRPVRDSIETDAGVQLAVAAAMRDLPGGDGVTVTVRPDAVVLQGHVADDATRTRIMQAARIAAPGRAIAAQIDTDEAMQGQIGDAVRAAGGDGVSVQVRRDAVLLEGRVPDDATLNRVVAAARAAAGRVPVTVRIQTDAAIEATVTAGLRRAGLDGVVVQVRPDTVALEGRVADDAARARAVDVARAAAAGRAVTDRLETDTGLEAAILAALRALGADAVTVEVRPDAVVLAGRVADEPLRQRVIAAARGRAGGRPLTVRVDADTAMEAAVATALRRLGFESLVAEVRGDAVVIEGRVPDDAAREQALAAARSAAAGRTIIDRIDTDSAAQGAVAEAVRRAGGAGVGVRAGPTAVELDGRVEDEAARARIVAAARGAAGGRAVVDRLDTDSVMLSAVSAALRNIAGGNGVSARVTADAVTLEGRVADDAARDRVIVAARQAAGGRAVVDRVEVDSGIQAAAAAAARRAAGDRVTAQVAGDGAVLLSGRAPDDVARDAAVAAVRAAVPGRSVIERIETDSAVQAGVQAAARRAGGSGVTVRASQDTLILEGRVTDDSTRNRTVLAARQAAAGRAVTDRLQTDAGFAAAIAAAIRPLGGDAVTVSAEGDGVRLQGTLRDEATRARVLAAARQAAQGRSVSDGLQTDANVEVAVLAAIRSAGGSGLNVRVQADSITLLGRVTDDATRGRILLAAREAGGGRSVVDQITTLDGVRSLAQDAAVRAGAEPISIDLSERAVNLTGRIRNESGRARVVAALRQALPGFEVQERLFVLPELPELRPGALRPTLVPDQLRARVEVALQQNGVLEPFATLDGGTAFVSGRAQTEAQRAQALAAVEALVPERTIVDYIKVGSEPDIGFIVPQRGGARLATECDRQTLPRDHPGRPAGVVGIGLFAIDAARARVACEGDARRDNGPAAAKLGLGLALLRDGASNDAFTQLMRAAAENDPYAMAYLGYLMEQNAQNARSLELARRWYTQASARGNAFALVMLGRMMRDGRGGARDLNGARTAFERAARLGSAAAMFELGVFYRDGAGVSADAAQARRWFERSAALGNVFADGELARLYTSGIGVPVDAARATAHTRDGVYHLLRALAQGDIDVARVLDGNGEGLSAGIRLEVQRTLATSGLYTGSQNAAFGPQVRAAIDSYIVSLR